MKKFLFVLLLLATVLYLSSCSSDDPDYLELPGTGGNSYQIITYNVDNISDWTSSLKATPIGSSGVKSLLYLVYNSNGVLVKQKIWRKGQNISLINDTLAQGNYSVVFYGSTVDDEDANIDPVSKYFLNKLNTDTTYFFLKNSINTDMFYSKSSLVVGKADMSQSITMPRIVGKVEVLISDASTVPTDVKSIQLALAPDHPTVFGLYGEQTLFTVGETESEYFMPVTELMTRAQFLTATSGNKALSFMALANTATYNKKGVKPNLCFIVEKTSGKKQVAYIKEGLEVTRNLTLRLQGNLFDKLDSSVGYGDINIEDQWGGTITEPIP